MPSRHGALYEREPFPIHQPAKKLLEGPTRDYLLVLSLEILGRWRSFKGAEGLHRGPLGGGKVHNDRYRITYHMNPFTSSAPPFCPFPGLGKRPSGGRFYEEAPGGPSTSVLILVESRNKRR